MICWYCYWGWATPVAEIYKDALAELNGDKFPLHYGPAHIVWEDENFDAAQWCLDNFDIYRGDNSDEELAAVRKSLERLAALPQETWDIEPDDYDDLHPENFPPRVPVERVR